MKLRLKEARKLKGMTLRESAKGLGFSYQYLHKIESDGLNVDSYKLIKFAKYYGVTTDFLVPSYNRPKIKLSQIHFCKIKLPY